MRRLPLAALAVAAAVFVVDQWVKYWITGVLDLDYLSAAREVTGNFRLTFVANCGVSLGLLGAHTDTPAVRWGVMLVTSAIAAAVLFWLWREKSSADRIALGAIFGGALGNIADRVIPADTLGKVTSGAVHYPGCVIDWADFHIGDYHPFMVVNAADVAITLGVLVLLARALLTRDRRGPMETSDA